jgi:hypothetical protein
MSRSREAGCRPLIRAELRRCPQRRSCTQSPSRWGRTCPWSMPSTTPRPPLSRILACRSGSAWSRDWSTCWALRTCRPRRADRLGFPPSSSRCPTGTGGTCQRRAGSTCRLGRGCTCWLSSDCTTRQYTASTCWHRIGRMIRPYTTSTCWRREERTFLADIVRTVSSHPWSILQHRNHGK